MFNPSSDWTQYDRLGIVAAIGLKLKKPETFKRYTENDFEMLGGLLIGLASGSADYLEPLRDSIIKVFRAELETM